MRIITKSCFLIALAFTSFFGYAHAQEPNADNLSPEAQSVIKDLVRQVYDSDNPEVTADANTIDQAHAEAFKNDPYPSAKKCALCHPKQYREWSVSPHAYAQLSPVFNAMSNKLIKKTSGTMGDFCIRCHTPIGMALNEPINTSNLNRHVSSREGVTCVVCHRVNQAWGRGAGRQAIVAGDLTKVIFGPQGNRNLELTLKNKDEYGVMNPGTNITENSRDVHSTSQRFFHQTTSGFCGACHDVFAPNGFRLEDAFSEFKASPAAKENGQSCQDCHMGKVPGKPEGYNFGPAAIVGNKPTPSRKVTNHMMAGPDHSIIHPALFPHHLTAIREENEANDKGFETMRNWLQFNVKAGWGKTQFENSLAKNTTFPEPWKDSLKRQKARDIIDDQLKLIKESHKERVKVLRAGYQMGQIQFTGSSRNGIEFEVPVSNITTGHGVPTGFDAERLVYLRAIVRDATGRVVFQSGDLDPNGDLRDSHSMYVHNGLMPQDPHLFSLQSRFITRSVRGGEREQILNVPTSLDPLPFMRPETRPFTVLGRPMGARKHKQNIEVGGTRMAKYTVSNRQLTGRGPYTVRVQLISGMVPVNLIHEISDMGFDYNMSAKEIADNVVGGHLVLYQQTRTLNTRSR